MSTLSLTDAIGNLDKEVIIHRRRLPV